MLAMARIAFTITAPEARELQLGMQSKQLGRIYLQNQPIFIE